MTIKRQSRKILSDYQLTSAYKETLAHVVRPWMSEPKYEFLFPSNDFLINTFNDLYKKNWVDLFKFNKDRKLYSVEQERLQEMVYADFNQIMKRFWNPHTNWDNCPFTGSTS